MKQLFNYPGSKWGMTETIINLFPPHFSYLEPFFGSGAVFFNKKPSAIETVNDIDGEIVNFFNVLRKQPDRLAERVSLTPYARDIYEEAQKPARSNFEKAYRFLVRTRFSFGFKTYQKSGFKIDIQGRERAYAVRCWNDMPDLIFEAAHRLKNVQIENRPAVDLIKMFNNKNVLIYADPPYLLNTRGGKQYRYEMTEQDHIELLEALIDHKGPAFISGYDSEMYNSYLFNWERVEQKRYNQNSERRTEVIWYKADQITFSQIDRRC